MNNTMDKFLEMVAADLYQRSDVDLAHTVVVFPGKRAMLFFNEYLASQSTDPDAALWAPTYMSISDLFASLSSKRLGDPVKLVCLLHKVFNATAKPEKPQPLDSFYFWGEMLLNDFNDVDKSMADAKALFRNMEDLKQMDDLSYIDETQRKAIEHFFGLFKKEGGSTELQKNFSRVWNCLFRIYQAYRDLLTKEGIAYEGMLYREAVEKLDVARLPFDRFVFVGFNVLTPVEKKLFSMLKNAGKALFYWDYDISYIDDINHEAATFLSQNVKQFPSPLGKEMFDSFSQPKEIRFVEASTENAQARYLTEWLPENLTTPLRDTAIVLCNEDILSPVLHSLPTVYKDKDAGKDLPIDYNITMGYPLVQTPAYSFVCAIMEAHAQGYKPERDAFRLSQIRNLLNHPFTLRLDRKAVRRYNELTSNNVFYPTPEEMKEDVVYEKEDKDKKVVVETVPMDDRFKQLFNPATDKRALCQLLVWALQEVGKTYRGLTDDQQQEEPLLIAYKEAIYEAYTKVNRFLTLIDDGTLADLQTSTFCSLLQRVLSSVRIPFHGEPAEGVQIMGVIETRNLDFRHLVMLSVNEGFMPRVANDVSFIPYVVRKAFGLTTIENKISVYAYYFYRLLQRAETVTLVYNAVTDDKHKGEMSRFMLQLLVSSPHHITRLQLSVNQKSQAERTIEVPKTDEDNKVKKDLMDVINGITSLSPTAINQYMRCPMSFYFEQVAGLRGPDSDSIEDARTFGNVFHEAAHHIYEKIKDSLGQVTEAAIDAILNDEAELQRHVDNAFSHELFADRPPYYDGLQLIYRNVLLHYVRLLLEADKEQAHKAPFTIKILEKSIYSDLTFQIAGQERTIRVGGKIDRLDQVTTPEGQPVLRVIDYKTGNKMQKVLAGVDEVFDNKKIDEHHSDYYLQAMLYSWLVRHSQQPFDYKGEEHAPLNEDNLPVQPALFFVQKKESRNDPVLKFGNTKEAHPIEDIKDHEEAFAEGLRQVIAEIFDPSVPFNTTQNEKRCKRCDFKALCHKEEDEYS